MPTTIVELDAAQVDARIARYEALRPMSTARDLEGLPQAAIDIVFARKLMPVILEDTKNPFGNEAPIIGAAGMTLFVSIMPPGQGPCSHSHDRTYETFFVLQGQIEFALGDPVTHRKTLNQWDCLSCPPQVYRGFKNVGTSDAVLLTAITGDTHARNDASMPHSVAERVQREHGDEVLQAFRALFTFNPPAAAGQPAGL